MHLQLSERGRRRRNHRLLGEGTAPFRERRNRRLFDFVGVTVVSHEALAVFPIRSRGFLLGSGSQKNRVPLPLTGLDVSL